MLVACILAAAASSAREPHINYVYPAGGQAGTTVEATIGGEALKDISEARVTGDGVTATIIAAEKPQADKGPKKRNAPNAADGPAWVRVKLDIAADAAPGERDLRLIGVEGASNRFRFFVGDLPEVVETEPNSDPASAQQVESLPVVVNGQALKGDRDCYRFAAKKGQTIVCEARARRILPYIGDAVPGWFQACLTLYDSRGNRLEYVDDVLFKPDPVLVFTCPEDGDYVLDIHDAVFRGREDFVYRIRIGPLPYITHIFPLGGKRGTETTVSLSGANLPQDQLTLNIPEDSPGRRYIDVPVDGRSSGAVPFAVGDLDELLEAEPNDSESEAQPIPPAVTVNGRIQSSGDVDYFRFEAEANETMIFEVHARRLDSPVDSVLTLLGPDGQELAENDDTVDQTEGLVTHHADSYLAHTFEQSGQYVLRLWDVQCQGGEPFAYRLTVAPAQPDFDLFVLPDNPRIAPPSTTLLTVSAVRRYGFDGEIKLSTDGLPEGFTATAAPMPGDQSESVIFLAAPPEFPVGTVVPTVKGTATIGGQDVVRTATPAEDVPQAFSYNHKVPTRELLLSVLPPSPFVLTHDVDPLQGLVIPASGRTNVTIKVDRKEGAEGAIKLAADGLPPWLEVKASSISPDKSEGKVLIIVKQAEPGVRTRVVLTGTIAGSKGKELTSAAPPITVLVVEREAKPKKK